MELGGARKNRKKSLFSPMGFFGNFSRSRGSQRGNYSEELKNIFLVQKTRNIWVESGVPRSLTMQLMLQLFLR